MTGWFYPERTHCLGCGKVLRPKQVIKRLYDSYECAGMTPPSDDPRDWPREHRTRKGEAKAAYTYPEIVGAQDNTAFHTYLCDYCGMYHVGHNKFSS